MLGENERELELREVIGFAGTVRNGLILHPDSIHMIFPIGSAVIIRNLRDRTHSFFQGHDCEVTCITVSPSGRYVASGQRTYCGFLADIILWDFQNLKELYRMRLHKEFVRNLAFSPEENYLASLGGEDNNLVIWRISDGRAICGARASLEPSHCVKFFHSSEIFLVTAGTYSIRIWEFDTRNKKLGPRDCNLGKIRRIATCMAIAEDDKYVFVGTQSGDFLEISLDRGLLKKSGPAKKKFCLGIECLHILKNGDLIVGTGAGELARLEYGTLRIRNRCRVVGGITSIAVAPDDNFFYAGTKTSNTYWIDSATMTPEIRKTCHYGRINSVTFPYDLSEIFATCSVDGIRIWRVRDCRELLRVQISELECFCVAFMRNGESIISGWSDGTIRAFLPQSGSKKYIINDAHNGGVTAIVGTSDSNKIISGGKSGDLRIWRISEKSQTMVISLKEHRSRIWSVQLRKNDMHVLSASADGSVVLWDLTSQTSVTRFVDTTLFKSVAYHPDEIQFITTGSNKKITYWDTVGGEKIRDVLASDKELTCLSMSPSGKFFVSGGDDRLLKIWDYESGESTHVGIAHGDNITSCCCSPDQKLLVSVGREGAIFLWAIPEEFTNKIENNY